MNEKEICDEQEYFFNVESLIDQRIDSLVDKLQLNKMELINERSEMWNDTTHLIRDFDDVVNLSINDQNVNMKQDEYLHILKDLNQLKMLKQSPYFARVDFKDDEDEEKEIIYIGKFSFYDKKKFKYYIYDWRTPIASLFYEQMLGDAYYTCELGERHGFIYLKRQYKIENSDIQYMYDTDESVQDDILGYVLSENTDNKLKVIIQSITKEQNKLIRNLTSKLMLISGPAGSGKTSVGMHRIAYMLYHKRKKVQSDNILLITKNDIFGSYISNILPELGENEISKKMYSDLITPFYGKEYVTYDYYEQIEYMMSLQVDTIRVDAIRAKNEYSFMQFIKKYINNIQIICTDLLYEETIIQTKEVLNKYWNQRLQEEPFSCALNHLNLYIKSIYENFFINNKSQIMKDIIEKSDEYLFEDEAELIFKDLLKSSIKQEQDYIIDKNQINIFSLYLKILLCYIDKQNLSMDIYNETVENLEDHVILYEDYTALAYIHMLIDDYNYDKKIEHVLIDEAQDFSQAQLYFIKALFPNSEFTLLADINQTVIPTISINSYSQLNTIFGEGLSHYTLSKSYRSTGPINALTFHMLNIHDTNYYFNRSGILPQYIVCVDEAMEISKIVQSDDSKTIGIITYNVHYAKELFMSLSTLIEVQLITDVQQEIVKQIVIMPIMLAKGLEFDTVIASISSNSDMVQYTEKVKYLMFTRALHKLFILSKEKDTDFLTNNKNYIEVKY